MDVGQLIKCIQFPHFLLLMPIKILTFMIGSEENQKDLEDLKHFIQAPKIYGFVSHFWYSTLRSKYPYQFIELMGKYRNFEKSHSAMKYEDELIQDAVKRIESLYADIKRYLILPPSNQKQIDDFNRKIKIIEAMLLKQAMLN